MANNQAEKRHLDVLRIASGYSVRLLTAKNIPKALEGLIK